MTFRDRLDEEDRLNAEVQRLNKLSVDLFNDLRESQFKVGDRDAEIERLKGENARLKQLNLMTDEQVVMALSAEIERLKDILDNEHAEMRIKNVLITECADALEKANPTDRYKTLIQRAREATK